VSYSQLVVVSSGKEGAEYGATVAGQRNGICGAALPGVLFLVTGTHTGFIDLTINELDGAPPLSDAEDVVEASFTPVGQGVTLLGWDGGALAAWDMPARPHRARWSLTAATQHAHDKSALVELERCVLDLWPAEPREDEIIRATEPFQYWHQHTQAD
jgi:hypothetical protein